ncbi:MAG: redox-regulated ATPase YchF [Synergistetes bacterium]|nr:MAG: GTP-binding and nucleic acid-binding protein YchF [bacterium 42_11]MBC7331419.1 redox-regulated ATPase YchF [Synergistota bacterium]MDK2872102.1 ribosome-binding ATPase [bacterium]
MALSLGIVGLPNAGKSTLFNALTRAGVLVASYPFSTIDPHKGVAFVPDERLEKLASLLRPPKVVPAEIEFYDIAGLVKGASRGEGLGNQFLSYIRGVDAIVEVVRAFESESVSHSEGSIDPIRDAQIIELELMLSDLELVERWIEKHGKAARLGDKKAREELEFLEKVRNLLARGEPLRGKLPEEELEKLSKFYQLLSTKPHLYYLNSSEEVDEGVLMEFEKWASLRNATVIWGCAKLEMELSELSEEEAQEFMKEIGIESSLRKLIRASYDILNLITFFTFNEKELRAWPVIRGTKVTQAAGKIHTDMEKGFIKAEVISVSKLLEVGDYKLARERGLIRIEGKDYVVQDGDIIYVIFKA